MTAPSGAPDRSRRRRALLRWGAFALGIVLFAAALSYMDADATVATVRRMGIGLPLALLFSGLWHLTRTWAWAWCFPQPRTVSFLRLVRVRLAAEAFSYLTLRGIAGEPLKVVLLGDRVGAREATAAVALERLAYLVCTMIIVGIGSLAAIAGLPLTPLWFRVFRAFAIVAALFTLGAVTIVAGRGDYMRAFLRWIDRRLGSSIAQGRVGGFIIAVERQMLELVRGNPVRLLALLTATVVSYLLMSLEAWVILRASGIAISPNAAVAVETFSRVASFASAFIPANLGALEASSLAAVAAVGVGGGAALAIGRRIRGLFWAGVGLAIYPRGLRPMIPRGGGDSAADGARPRTTLLYLPWDPDVSTAPGARLAGLTIPERVLRAAHRAGYERIVIWLPREASPERARIVQSAARAVAIEAAIATNEREWERMVVDSRALGGLTAIGAGTVAAPALLRAARDVSVPPGESRDVPAGAAWPESGVIRVSALEAVDVGRLLPALAERRRRAAAMPTGIDVSAGRALLALRVARDEDLPQAEATLRRATYKDTDATVARFNRRLSLPISVALIRTPITANQLSLILVAIGFYSAWLFSLGHYWTGVAGALLSLAASVLDGCDGEIARLKYQESALGCWVETFGDYSYYIAIFIGLSVGAARQTRSDAFYWIGAAALAGTLITFALLIYLRSRITGGQPDKLHAVARDRFRTEESRWSSLIWRLSFVATRSAMPYGIVAFALVRALPAIVLLAAIGCNVYWISLVLKLRHLLDEGDPVPV